MPAEGKDPVVRQPGSLNCYETVWEKAFLSPRLPCTRFSGGNRSSFFLPSSLIPFGFVRSTLSAVSCLYKHSNIPEEIVASAPRKLIVNESKRDTKLHFHRRNCGMPTRGARNNGERCFEIFQSLQIILHKYVRGARACSFSERHFPETYASNAYILSTLSHFTPSEDRRAVITRTSTRPSSYKRMKQHSTAKVQYKTSLHALHGRKR